MAKLYLVEYKIEAACIADSEADAMEVMREAGWPACEYVSLDDCASVSLLRRAPAGWDDNTTVYSADRGDMTLKDAMIAARGG